jgi:sugar lactone lactonase YvrE
MARLVGILPVLAISAALSLDAWAAALERTGRVLRSAAAALVVVVAVALAVQNFGDFFERYTRSTPPPFSGTVGQASFVRETNARAAAAGEPLPRYQELGAHAIYWGHSVNRFLNPTALGRDMANPAHELPFGVSADAPTIFMVWEHNAHYLPIVEELFPGGRKERVFYGTPGRRSFLFTTYRVAAGEVARRHAALATYEPASGPALSRLEAGFATGELSRLRLAYPAHVRLSGELFAPAFARYRLEVAGAKGTSLAVDGVPAFAADASAGELVLARGLHRVEVRAPLEGAAARVRLRWCIPGGTPRPVRRPFVWDGGGGALLGFVRALPKGEPATRFFGSAGFESLPLVAARVDSFLGFKDISNALAGGEEAVVAVWKGRLRAGAAGETLFELHANRGARLVVDGRVAVDLPEGGPTESTGKRALSLGTGAHEIEVWDTWRRGGGVLELFVTPPSGPRHLMAFDDLEPVVGAWRPGEITERGGPAPVLEDTRAAKARAVVDLKGSVTAPRAIAVTPEGELLVADTGGHRVVRLDSRGKVLGAFGRAGRGPGEFERLEDVAVGPHGRIYTLDSGFARVQVFSRDGALLRTLGADANLCTPAGFGVGADGAVYVADTCGGRIVKLDGKGRRNEEIRPAPPEKLEQPVDVAIGADGLLYVADLTPRVIALDPATGAVKRSWSVPVGTLEGAANLALDGPRLYMSDANRSVVRVIDVSGDDVESREGDPSAPFNAPVGLACSPGRGLFVIDGNGTRLQVFDERQAETSR